MKMITSIIRPERLPDVKEELFKVKVYRMTVGNVIGAGQQKGFKEQYRGVIQEIRLNKKIKVEIAVNDSFVETTVKAIIRGARSNGGRIGDGKIFVSPLDDCIRIRTGEAGIDAIGGTSDEVEKGHKKRIIKA